MAWLGWIVAVVAIGFAVWLARQLASERALTTQLRFAKIEADENVRCVPDLNNLACLISGCTTLWCCTISLFM